jgi:serine phosphatase RsbU (regulator of sigma subunit)
VPDGFVYDALVGQISSTLRRTLVLETLLKEARARETAESHRLEDEMRIATEIQKGILPRTVRIEGLDIAAFMRPAASVGGDYYDVIPTPDGCWIGIGDVSGHGLVAGLVMLMLQSVVSGVARRRPGALPSEVLSIVNAVIYENVRARMAQEEHLTLTLLRYERTGRLVGAGAHEVILVCRAEDGRTEYVDIPGTWVGLVPDIREATSDTEFELRAGDLLVLHTDGLTEARNEDGEMFGLERLAATLASARHETAETVRDALVAAVERWTCAREDDMSLLVARQRGPL